MPLFIYFKNGVDAVCHYDDSCIVSLSIFYFILDQDTECALHLFSVQ